MNNSKKRGFTIVELVIVIAVIAILAGVLIPTFTSIVKKANQSVDIQACTNMNKQLAIAGVDSTITTVDAAVAALDKVDLDIEDYKALQKDHYFYFVVDQKGTPTIIYTDKDNNILFPENVALAPDAQWMSLSGSVPTDSNYTVASDGKVTINSGAKLAHLIEAKKGTSEALEITLSGKVDLKGAAVDFGTTNGNITIKGESGATLSGLRASKNTVSPTSGEYANHSYGFGIFGDVNSGKVVLQDIVISGLMVGNTLETHEKGANTVGLVAGYIRSGATVEIKNVTFKDCVVNGYQKVGAIVGQHHGTLTMENVKFENVVVNGYTEVAKIAGWVNTTGKLTVTSCDLNGLSVVGLMSGTFSRSAFDVNNGITLSGSATNTFYYSVGYDNPAYDGIYAAATDDYAWYSAAAVNSAWDKTYRSGAAQYNGEDCYLNGAVFSASTNLVNGKPV